MAERPKANDELFARYVRGLWKLARMRSTGDAGRKYLALQAEFNSLNGDDAEYWQNMQTRVEDMALLLRGTVALKAAAQFVDPYGEGCAPMSPPTINGWPSGAPSSWLTWSRAAGPRKECSTSLVRRDRREVQLLGVQRIERVQQGCLAVFDARSRSRRPEGRVPAVRAGNLCSRLLNRNPASNEQHSQWSSTGRGGRRQRACDAFLDASAS